jgi:hypothetical protein
MRLGLLAPALVGMASVVGVLSRSPVLVGVGWIGVACALVLALLLMWLMRRPVLAYRSGQLLVYLRAGRPFRVPIDVVEGFFLGSGPLKLSDQWEAPYRTVNVIIRLAEKATDWADRPVKPSLGRWAESYIMIFGAWCEPLSLEVVSRLNVRLHRIQHGEEACQCPSVAAEAGECGANKIIEPHPHPEKTQ